MNLRVASLAALFLCLVVVSASAALPYTNLYVLGDSTVDVGNAFLATGGTTPDPAQYWNGRASNGPVWVEDLAALLHLPPQAPGALPGTTGTNYAFYGARVTGPTNLQPPPMNVQVGASLAAHQPLPTDLYVLSGGVNDLLAGQLDPAIPASAITSHVAALAASGARQFLVAEMPPLGQFPLARGTPQEAFANQWAMLFNSTLHAGLADLQAAYPDARIDILPSFDLFVGVLNGSIPTDFKNLTDPALNFPSANPDEFVFWDLGHPTRAVHQFIATQAYGILVPEPSSLVLLLGSFFALRRRRAS